MKRRYFRTCSLVTIALLLAYGTACKVDSVLTLTDDLSDLIITDEEETAIYAYTSGDQMLYEIYVDTIEVYDSETLSIGTIVDGTIINDNDVAYYITVTDETITIWDGTNDPLIYTRV